jgi:hypothetical protein
MGRLRSAALVAWTNAWLVGRTGSDEVIRAATGPDAPHRVAGLSLEPAPLSELLIGWRRTGHRAMLCLPVPGDVRGVPGPVPFRAGALDAGEAAYCGDLGAVPNVVDHFPSSAPTTVTWSVHAVIDARPDVLSVTDAQYELTVAIRQAAGALAAADLNAHRADVSEQLHNARRAGQRLDLPPGFPPPAVALLAQAERMQAVLDLARMDPVGGAVDRTGMAAREAALRPLASAVRRARLAAYNCTAE